MHFPDIVNIQLYKIPPLVKWSQWVEVSSLIQLSADKVKSTFTNVVADLVSRQAGDQSLTDITPPCVHAALVKLAAMCRQTLIHICRKESRRFRIQTMTGA